jgi:diguanylate cyclase (GGDEF)-like protein
MNRLSSKRRVRCAGPRPNARWAREGAPARMLADFAIPIRRLLEGGTTLHLFEADDGTIVRASHVLETAAKRRLVGTALDLLVFPTSLAHLVEVARRGSPDLVLVQFRDADAAPFTLRCAVEARGRTLLVAGEPPMEQHRQLTEQLFTINAELNVLNRETSRRANSQASVRVVAASVDGSRRGASAGSPPSRSVERRMFEMNNELVVTARELTRRTRELEAAKQLIEEQARRDGLTGLFNRRHLFEVLNLEIERAKRGLQRLSLVLVDLDHFKTVNDEHGHAAGDAVLAAAASFMKKSLRPYDIAARYGGEEFILLLPSTPVDDARLVAERLRGGLEGLSIEGHEKKVTASFGVAEWRASETSEALIARADRALYDAKDAGRNRVVVAASEEGAK